jgi:hypothetical protein
MGKDNASIGKAGLWISRVGWGLPALLLILDRCFLHQQRCFAGGDS